MGLEGGKLHYLCDNFHQLFSGSQHYPLLILYVYDSEKMDIILN